ncbi:golgin candidate 1 isoform X1 [Trifolium pratense]|uniref:golgin candidate 1 isoform X1 n=1 Tax=Trifolium pratense TaxID=57577 RepID=UPI001E694AA4|nr:golgin candidate 1 isoform X1 [Trifolium pratense]
MASWLKVAEDLFEVVDRRAKLVASDVAEEQSDSKSPASNGQGSQGKRKKSKPKKGPSDPSTIISDDATKEKSGSPAATLDVSVTTPSDKVDPVAKNDGSDLISTNQPKDLQPTDPTSPILGTSLSKELASDTGKHDTGDVEVLVHDADVDVTTTSSANNEPVKENASDTHEVDPSPSPKGIKDHNHESTSTEPITKSGDLDSNPNTDQEKTEPVADDVAPNSDTILKGSDTKAEPIVNQKSQGDHKTDISPKKVQDQLEEAQGLLKTTKSTGQSKEARLARVCAGLSSRLQEYKSENAQLEELLTAERELSKSYEASIKQLQKDLSESKKEVTRVESNMAEALAAKNAEIESVLSSVEAIKRQAALSEGNLASLQANMESMMRNRELSETRMMQALREELASVERRAEEERAAHNATKLAAMGREVELEHRAVESSTALARIQRIADERTAKATDLEQKVALLEVECSSLNQELQDMEVRLRREQKKSPEEANQVIQIQAWQEEVERARQGQREAENKLSSLEAELQKLRVEMAAMKRDAEHYSRQEHTELEKRYRELTDLLVICAMLKFQENFVLLNFQYINVLFSLQYYKQTQLETMVSEKAATEFQLEKEIKHLKEAQAETERSRVSRRASSAWEDESEIKALEPLPLHHRHLAGASIQLQKAIKLLDSGAVRATRFLWRYPTARVFLFFYLVFVHLFLMYLLHRLQVQADSMSDREVAASMGLSNQSLP